MKTFNELFNIKPGTPRSELPQHAFEFLDRYVQNINDFDRLLFSIEKWYIETPQEKKESIAPLFSLAIINISFIHTLLTHFTKDAEQLFDSETAAALKKMRATEYYADQISAADDLSKDCEKMYEKLKRSNYGNR